MSIHRDYESEYKMGVLQGEILAYVKDEWVVKVRELMKNRDKLVRESASWEKKHLSGSTTN